MSMPTPVLVSNRLPVTLSFDPEGKLEVQQSAGGLVTALAGIHSKPGSLWIGWPGSIDVVSPDSEEYPQNVIDELFLHQLVPVYIPKQEFHDYYDKYSNGEEKGERKIS